MKDGKLALIIGVCFVVAGLASAQTSGEFPDSRSPSAWQHFESSEYGEEWLKLDRNDDGVIDYAVMVNDRGQKFREAADFNYDGKMDDFYFYDNDVLQRQEIDTNFDLQIDVWVYLRRGVYVEMWERDRDYDGVIDDRKRYGSADR